MEVEIWTMLVMILTSCNLYVVTDLRRKPIANSLRVVMPQKNIIQK